MDIVPKSNFEIWTWIANSISHNNNHSIMTTLYIPHNYLLYWPTDEYRSSYSFIQIMIVIYYNKFCKTASSKFLMEFIS